MNERSSSSLLGWALHEAAINKETRLARVIASEDESVDFI
jgi:hypothetical protein